MLTPQLPLRRYSIGTPSILLSLVVVALSCSVVLQAQRLTLATRTFGLLESDAVAEDASRVPSSQPLSITLHLTATPARVAALEQLLVDQTTSSSPKYHKWLTPQQFAADYGATDDQIAKVTDWVAAQGLSVAAISPGRTRLTVSGSADQVQRAFAVTLHRYQLNAKEYFANTNPPSLPQEIAALVTGVSGLDDMPATASTALSRFAGAGQSTTSVADDRSGPLIAAAAAIDANAEPVLALSSAACASDFGQSDYDAYLALFRQASAQGITVLASSGCGAGSSGSFPASLTEVTALATKPEGSDQVPIAPRPSWQSAPGLPADAGRHEPDLTTNSMAAFAQTINSIVRQTGTRQGNINPILYSLATTPELYTQPDAAPAGTWEPATGLGLIDLNTLLKVFPRGTTSTTTTLTSNTYSVGYGAPIVLTSKVSASSFNVASPTGTVSFTSSTQGTVGSSPLTGDTATLNLSALPVGTYTITANYSGDANYAASASTSSVITVSIVNATLMATISPATSVPYGSTATVTATVAMPNSSAAPSGTVSASVQGVTGAVYTATLTPNPGGNTATANIVVAAPAPGKYTVEVTCAGNANFQCQTPVNLPVTTIIGNTITTVTVNPAAPQAGQPVTLTAAVNNAGNGNGTYTFSGTVTFYDNGLLIATAPVGTNQATTSKTLSGNVQHSIVAKYSGDANWNLSTSAPQAVSPTLLPSSLTLTANTYNTLAGVNIVFTATAFTTVANTVGPTGTVTFYDTYNGAVVQVGAPSTLAPNGPNQSIAVFSTTGLLAGTHSIYAIYNGDANFGPATSTTLALNLSDYNLNMIPQTLTLHPGQTGKVVMLLGLVGGFNGTVSFGCTPPSNAEVTCSFSPLTLSGGGSTTMSIVTTAAKAKTQEARLWSRSRWSLASGVGFAALLCFAAPRRRRSLPTLLTALLAVCLTANLGCGKGTSATIDPPATTPSDPGTPLGTQIFTITTAGSDGVSTVRHNYQYQVTIQ